MQRDRSFEVHFGWGAAIALALIIWAVPPVWAMALAITAGVLVELIQLRWPVSGQASVEDAIFTGLGAVAGALISVLALAA
jgi:glycopeptide antibiotics resistance protein